VRIEPEINAVAIVLLGKFEPTIFTPAWLALIGMLSPRAVDTAQVEIVNAQTSSCSAEGFDVHVTQDSFQVVTRSVPLVRVRDIVLHIFTEQLSYTSVDALGISRVVHFRAENRTARDQVGRILAPVEPWGGIADKLQLDDAGNGMASLTMRQARSAGGQVNVTVEPSTQIGDGSLGIYVRVNDNYQRDATALDGRKELFSILDDGFDESMCRAESIIDQVMSLAEAKQEGSSS